MVRQVAEIEGLSEKLRIDAQRDSFGSPTTGARFLVTRERRPPVGETEERVSIPGTHTTGAGPAQTPLVRVSRLVYGISN